MNCCEYLRGREGEREGGTGSSSSSAARSLCTLQSYTAAAPSASALLKVAHSLFAPAAHTLPDPAAAAAASDNGNLGIFLSFLLSPSVYDFVGAAMTICTLQSAQSQEGRHRARQTQVASGQTSEGRVAVVAVVVVVVK